jgi:cation transport regulator
MPYKTLDDLPESVKNVLPHHAMEIFKEAFNSAYDQYDKPEERRGDDTRDEVAMKVAWSAVKKKYEKNEDTGKWVAK